MEAKPRQQLPDDKRSAAARRWPGLRGEAKLAWQFLWRLAGGQPGRVVCHPGSVAEDQGTTDSSGRRALKALEEHGLIQVIDKDGAQWLVYVEDPLETAKAHIARATAGDVQPDLFPETSSEAPPDPKADPEFARSGKGSSGAQTERLKVMEVLTLPIPEAKADPAALARDVAAAMRTLADRVQLSHDHEPLEATKITGLIVSQVNDPNLLKSVCDKISWAIVQGVYPRRKLEDILTRIRRDHSHRSCRDRGSYFLGAMKRSFEECGLDLYEKKK